MNWGGDSEWRFVVRNEFYAHGNWCSALLEAWVAVFTVISIFTGRSYARGRMVHHCKGLNILSVPC